MNFCATCKHWKGKAEKVEWNTFGECPVLMDPMESQGTYLFEPQIVGAEDAWADRLSVQIETHANFGCPLHEEKGG